MTNEEAHAESSSKVTNRLLLVTNTLQANPSGGRELLSKLNFDVLTEIYVNRLELFELVRNPVKSMSGALAAYKGHIDGINTRSIQSIITVVAEKSIESVFIDGSNLGELAYAVKRTFPAVRIVTFCHNVESRFFWDSFKQRPTLRTLAVYIANYMAERKSVRFSDRIIALSRRDSKAFEKVYGRPATDISAIALDDSISEMDSESDKQPAERYALFVGGTFFANLAGIFWYAEHVAPFINIKTMVIGKGFDKYKDDLEKFRNIEVIGYVESVQQWYRYAEFVVAPIFGGSGMKTKVAEALMHGKHIIGTSEAFSGYESVLGKLATPCDSPDEFITALNALIEKSLPSFDPELRQIYVANYSLAAAQSRLMDILGCVPTDRN